MTDWAEEQPTIELLKQTITMHDVVEMLGYEVGADNKIISPWNQFEKTPSCHVYEDHIYCYSTGNHADIIDLVQLTDPMITVPKALWLLWNKALRAGREPGDVEHQPVRDVVDFSDEINIFDGPDPDWKRLLGVQPPEFTCKDDGNSLLIGHFDEDGCYGVKVRHRDGAKSAWPGSQFTKRLYHAGGWDFGGVVETSVGPRGTGLLPDVAIITEGESDAWHVEAMKLFAHVFALPGGAGSWKDAWLKDLEPYEKVILIFDNDDAGKKARDKLERKIGFLRVEHAMVPQLYNDVREAVKAGWDGADLRRRVSYQYNTR